MFLEKKGMPVLDVDNSKCTCGLVFSADVTGHLSVLNLSLQGKSQIITQPYDSVLAFKRKFLSWEEQLSRKDTSHFSKMTDFEEYAKLLSDIRSKFDARF